jgi:archaellum component FlaC
MYLAGNGYLEEFKAVRKEIKTQSERVLNQAKRLETSVDGVSKSFQTLREASKKLEKVCRF